MLIEQSEHNGKGKFYVEQDGQQLAEIEYSMPAKDKMIIHHTEVDDVLRGKNVGLQLVNRAVEYARTNNIKIIPLCPFAKSVFDRKPELADVLFKL
jgi:uncharacterized protein